MLPQASSSFDGNATATSRALQMFDVLDLIAKQFNNRKALWNICLVNRAFNHVFSRQLYRCLRWDEHNCRFLVDEDKWHKRVHVLLKPLLQAGGIPFIYALSGSP
ncbi:hypothetical protein F4808DRAFT_287265 [Astrocystis sublimbata]|nr:hypothetical protein F4808DRAFT_287265 [Astrocystis sublimbata]